jgi:small GTP-binding protein
VTMLHPATVLDPAGSAATHAFKVVVTGPVGVGKTTFISTISEIETVATEAAISDGTGTGTKTTTTVGIDFGRLAVGGGMELYLFGTPGQQRFDFMWDITAEGALGVILLLDCQRPDTYPEARKVLEHFRSRVAAPTLVAANKVDDFATERPRIVEALGLSEHDFVVPTNALERGAVKQTLIELLELVVAFL